MNKLILNRRTIRKFKQKKISKTILTDCIDAARLAPSAGNLQPLEYILVTEKLDEVFKCVKWAGYLEDGSPRGGEEPTAYIIIISNSEINKDARYDVGLAIGNIITTALEKGIASCVIGSLDRCQLTNNFKIPNKYIIELVIALGYPKQTSKKEVLTKSIKYWLDKKGILHVPKRKLKDIVHREEFKF
jgi:nitroreductase